jgi:hypothetical protein
MESEIEAAAFIGGFLREGVSSEVIAGVAMGLPHIY